MRYQFEGSAPRVHEDAFVTDEATLIGEVRVEREASVWPGAILRGDVGPVTVGESTHVEDNVTVHASSLGKDVMVGHGVVIDVATVDDGVLLGSNATINADVSVGIETIVAAGAVIPDGRTVPPRSFVSGVPATVEPLSDTSVDPDDVFEYYSSDVYVDLASRYDTMFE